MLVVRAHGAQRLAYRDDFTLQSKPQAQVVPFAVAQCSSNPPISLTSSRLAKTVGIDIAISSLRTGSKIQPSMGVNERIADFVYGRP